MIVLTLSMLLMFSGCQSKPTFTFPPQQEADGDVTSQDAVELQAILEKMGPMGEKLTFVAYSAEYVTVESDETESSTSTSSKTESGETKETERELLVHGFFRNNTGRTITDISATIDVRQKQDPNLATPSLIEGETDPNLYSCARGEFIFEPSKLGEIENKDSRPWTLRFTSDCLVNELDVTRGFVVNADFKYTVK